MPRLNSLHPLLTGPLVHWLLDAGHGDWIFVVDRNYSAAADAKRGEIESDVIRLDGCTDSLAVVEAILGEVPVDGMEADGTGPAFYIIEMWGQEPEVNADQHRRFVEMVCRAKGIDPHDDEGEVTVKDIVSETPRYMFHNEARDSAGAIVVTGDPRHFMCFAIRIGAQPEPE